MTTPSTVTRLRISGHSKALTSGFGKARPDVSIDDVLGRRIARQQRFQRRHEILGDGAAEAAVRQLDDVFLGAALDAARAQDRAVDADVAELVDDQRQAAALGILDQRGGPASFFRRREIR